MFSPVKLKYKMSFLIAIKGVEPKIKNIWIKIVPGAEKIPVSSIPIILTRTLVLETFYGAHNCKRSYERQGLDVNRQRSQSKKGIRLT